MDQPGGQEFHGGSVEDELIDCASEEGVDEASGVEEAIFLLDWGGGGIPTTLGTKEEEREVDRQDLNRGCRGKGGDKGGVRGLVGVHEVHAGRHREHYEGGSLGSCRLAVSSRDQSMLRSCTERGHTIPVPGPEADNLNYTPAHKSQMVAQVGHRPLDRNHVFTDPWRREVAECRGEDNAQHNE